MSLKGFFEGISKAIGVIPQPSKRLRKTGTVMKRGQSAKNRRGAFKRSGKGRARRSYRILPANMRRR